MAAQAGSGQEEEEALRGGPRRTSFQPVAGPREPSSAPTHPNSSKSAHLHPPPPQPGPAPPPSPRTNTPIHPLLPRTASSEHHQHDREMGTPPSLAHGAARLSSTQPLGKSQGRGLKTERGAGTGPVETQKKGPRSLPGERVAQRGPEGVSG